MGNIAEMSIKESIEKDIEEVEGSVVMFYLDKDGVLKCAENTNGDKGFHDEYTLYSPGNVDEVGWAVKRDNNKFGLSKVVNKEQIVKLYNTYLIGIPSYEIPRFRQVISSISTPSEMKVSQGLVGHLGEPRQGFSLELFPSQHFNSDYFGDVDERSEQYNTNKTALLQKILKDVRPQ